ncbi:MAG: response regulator [Anaerolineae bacterium]|nr:response regulator [Anaerolineae bacterium]
MKVKLRLSKFILTLSLMLWLSTLSIQAQGGDDPPLPGQVVHFEQLTGETKRSSILDITQDSQGFLWFGGSDGLYRFDGYNTTIFRYNPNDSTSLSSNWVSDVLIDSYDDLWVGTRTGLNRFDPQTQRFTRYQHQDDNPHSLSENRISALLEDSRGNLWVGTRSGLNRLDRASGQFSIYTHDPDNPNSLSHNAVTAIAEDAQGALWVTTQGGVTKLLLAADGSAQFTRYQNNPDDPHSLSENFVVSALVDSQDTLWIGTWGGGLNQLTADEREKAVPQFVRYQHQPENPHSLSHNILGDIFEDSQGILWVGTMGNGLNQYDRQHKTFQRYVHDSADPYSLSGNNVISIFEDAQGLLWVGIEGGGVNKFNRNTLAFGHHRQDPTDPNTVSDAPVLAFTKDAQGGLWIGTNGGGLNYLQPDDGPEPTYFIQYRFAENDPHSLSSDNVKDIIRDSQGNLWIATEEGLNQLQADSERESPRFIRYQHDENDPDSLSANLLETVFEDSHGNLWVGTFFGGLDQLLPGDEPGSTRFIHHQNDPDDPTSLSSNIVYVISEDSQGVLWLGTRGGGLNKMIPGDVQNEPPHFIRYQHDENNPRSLASTTVYDVMEDSQGRLWVGTWGGGLQQLDRTSDAFTSYMEKDGFSDYVFNIMEDGQGYLWLNTLRGLARFDPTTETFVHYDESDGLVTFYEGRAYQDQAGNFYFGGLNGFNVFQPADIPTNRYDPRLLLTDFRLFNEPVPVGGDSLLQHPIWATDSLTLSAADDIISFEFAALDYIAPEKIRYQYKLDGYEAAWNEVASDRRYSTYTNLPAGDYTFRVRSTNSAGHWSENEVTLNIAVLPPWWQTTWFRGIVLSALLGLTYLTYRLRVRSVEQRNQELEVQVAERTIELLAANQRLTHTQTDLQQRADQLAALNEVGTALASTLELDLAIARILEELKKVVPYDSASVQILKEGYLEIVGEYVGENTSVDPTDVVGMKFPVPGNNPNTVVIETRRAYHVPDAVAEYAIFLEAIHHPIQSWLGVPLIVQNRIIGILALDSYTKNHFNDDYIDLATTFAGQAAIAIENARLFEAAREAQDKAEVASRAKSTFLTNMSHELRTPLNAILGFSQLAKHNQNNPVDTQENLSIIVRSGEHLLTLINQVLDLSKIEAGRMTPNPTNFDLQAMLADLREMFSLQAQGKGLQIHFEQADDLPRIIRTDEMKLRQVLINLFSNAVKFTAYGSVSLQVRVGEQEAEIESPPDTPLISSAPSLPPTSYTPLHFEVSDTGPGIDPNEWEHLFEAFVQSENGHQAQEGTGLGLPISRTFVQLMGGDLRIESNKRAPNRGEVTSASPGGIEDGPGITFAFHIQVEVIEEIAMTNEKSDHKGQVVGLAPGQPCYRLLIVDDDPINRQLLRKLFTNIGSPESGFKLREAENGKEAIELWETFAPHLIWMDLRMPVMDGYQATKIIQAKQAKSHNKISKIIALTASSYEEDQTAVLAIGCDDFLRKPFRETDIFTLLEHHLGVHFIYKLKAGNVGVPASVATQTELAAGLTAVPKHLRTRLEKAAQIANLDEVESTINQIETYQPDLAGRLAQLADAFDYLEIVALLQEVNDE